MQILKYKNYKQYLRDELDRRTETKKGGRSKLAGALRCHTAYISQVLNGNAHLSLEQADMTNIFLAHTENEAHFFLLLVQYNRAGTKSLQTFFAKQIDRLIDQYSELELKLKKEEKISAQAHEYYYSRWYAMAIHALSAHKNGVQAQQASQYLGLPLHVVLDVLDFLYQNGIISLTESAQTYKANAKSFHISKESPLNIMNLINWRNQAIRNLDGRRDSDLHYSSVISVKDEDAKKIKNILNDAIEKCRDERRGSKPEEIYAYNVDFFSLKNQIR